MQKNKYLFKNRWLRTGALIGWFITAWILAPRLFFSKSQQLPKITQEPFTLLDTVAHTAPRQFWKFPTTISLARAPGLLLRFIFRMPNDFQEVWKK